MEGYDKSELLDGKPFLKVVEILVVILFVVVIGYVGSRLQISAYARDDFILQFTNPNSDAAPGPWQSLEEGKIDARFNSPETDFTFNRDYMGQRHHHDQPGAGLFAGRSLALMASEECSGYSRRPPHPNGQVGQSSRKLQTSTSLGARVGQQFWGVESVSELPGRLILKVWNKRAFMSIKVFTTGGSIDKIYSTKESSFVVGEPQVGHILHEANVNIDYKIESLIKKDSLEITDDDRRMVLEKVKSDQHRHIVITHGTDTMILTAEMLEGIPDKVIVLTGAMQPAAFKRTDAAFNVGCAIIAVQTLPEGVYVVMNGQVFDPHKVRKNLGLDQFEEI
jgi:L-asparaginase